VNAIKTKNTRGLIRLLPHSMVTTLALLAFATGANAAAPGIAGTGSTAAVFNLVAEAAHISQPDGAAVYSWGYGCATGSTPTFKPEALQGSCPTMQIPGPTLIVTQGQPVTVTLANNLPASAGNTSMLFPGFNVTTSGGVAGVLTREASHTTPVTYTFTASQAGTHVYYSGTQADLQIEMGLYGTIIVVPPAGSTKTSGCTALGVEPTRVATAYRDSEGEFRLAKAAYDHAATCYDREYLFQFSEIDPRIHRQAEEQVMADDAKSQHCARANGCLAVETEPYHPAYYMINGRSMPDDMDPNYAIQYPHQPYNGNPHMHPGELVLLRVVGTGRWQHPFHEHGNHVRVLGRDGNLLVSQTDSSKLAGPLLFTTTTTPGQALDGIFYWTGKGLNWDVYAHRSDADGPCVPDANGYYTIASGAPVTAPNYYEWCGDHKKALEKNPLGDVPTGGPVTLPDANILANGAWYGGSPYMGPEATLRAVGTTPIPPSGTVANDPGSEAGFAFMWHSHNEREITTNNAFPGGMMMMMLVDPQAFQIDETK
jgi:FtsP/CotA-like multicopper oxidase with cupredoxin domain